MTFVTFVRICLHRDITRLFRHVGRDGDDDAFLNAESAGSDLEHVLGIGFAIR